MIFSQHDNSYTTKDKVKVGQLSRGGYHRGKTALRALDKDQQWQISLVPLGYFGDCERNGEKRAVDL